MAIKLTKDQIRDTLVNQVIISLSELTPFTIQQINDSLWMVNGSIDRLIEVMVVSQITGNPLGIAASEIRWNMDHHQDQPAEGQLPKHIDMPRSMLYVVSKDDKHVILLQCKGTEGSYPGGDTWIEAEQNRINRLLPSGMTCIILRGQVKPA